MTRDEIRLVVLYEDDTHGKFVRKLTKKLGLRPMRLQPCGDCNALMDRFESELRVVRSKMKYQKNLGLLVLIDADDADYNVRIRELEHRLLRSGTGGPRDELERIAFMVPALEIENWYVHLCIPEARPVDEGRDYKPLPEWRALAKDLAAAAQQAVDAWDEETGRADPQSLVAARGEVGRLL